MVCSVLDVFLGWAGAGTWQPFHLQRSILLQSDKRAWCSRLESKCCGVGGIPFTENKGMICRNMICLCTQSKGEFFFPICFTVGKLGWLQAALEGSSLACWAKASGIIRQKLKRYGINREWFTREKDFLVPMLFWHCHKLHLHQHRVKHCLLHPSAWAGAKWREVILCKEPTGQGIAEWYHLSSKGVWGEEMYTSKEV